MQLGAHARIIVEQSGRDTHRGEISGFPWRSLAADAAEGPETAWRRFELLYQILTRQQPELVSIDVNIAGKGSTAQLAAIAAMAMGEGSNRINLESDTTAEATAFDHHITRGLRYGTPMMPRLWPQSAKPFTVLTP